MPYHGTMSNLSRRSLMTFGVAAASAPASAPAPAIATAAGSSAAAQGAHNNRIRQSVCRWCYEKIPLDELCAQAAALGLKGIDLLQPDEYQVPLRYGLRCTMGYAGHDDLKIGLNRPE